MEGRLGWCFACVVMEKGRDELGVKFVLHSIPGVPKAMG